MNEYAKKIEEQENAPFHLSSRQERYIRGSYVFVLNEFYVVNKWCYNVNIDYVSSICKTIQVSHRDFETRLAAMRWIEVQNKLLFPEEGEENGRGID